MPIATQGGGTSLELQVNANLLRHWVKRAASKTALISGGGGFAPEKIPSFVPVTLTAPKSSGPAEHPIRVQVRKRGLRLTIEWPLAAAGACAGWSQELLG